jgi:transcriptional regulator with XRE-family HTH domain
MKKDADIAARLGQRVRELRKAKELSQEAFAAACGLDRTSISGIGAMCPFATSKSSQLPSASRSPS